MSQHIDGETSDRRAAEPRPEAEEATPAAGERTRRRGALVWTVVGAGAIALLLLAGAYTAYWFLTFETLRSEVATWIDQRRSEGYRLSYQGEERSGFPFVVRLSLRESQLAAPQGWSWLSTDTRLEAHPFDLDRLRVVFAGEQELRFPGGAESATYSIRGEVLAADVLDARTAPHGSLSAQNLTLARKGDAATLRIRRLDGAAFRLPGADDDGRLRSFTLNAGGVTLPEGVEAPLGREIARVALAMRLTGAIQALPWREAVARWRDDGGVVEVDRIDVAYGPLGAAGDGAVALDRRGEPLAAFSLQMTGVAATLSRLEADGVISSAAARALGWAARFAEQSPTPGAPAGAEVVALPVSLQDGVVSVGPLPVFTAPKLGLGIPPPRPAAPESAPPAPPSP